MSGCGKRVQGRGGKTRSKTTCGEASCCGGRCYRRRRGSNFVGYGLNALEAAEGWLCLRNPRRRGPAWRRSDCCAPRLCSLAALLCAGSAWRFTARSRPGICRYAGVVVQLPKRYKVSAVSPCISREAAAAPIAVSAATTHQRMDVAYIRRVHPAAAAPDAQRVRRRRRRSMRTAADLDLSDINTFIIPASVAYL